MQRMGSVSRSNAEIDAGQRQDQRQKNRNDSEAVKKGQVPMRGPSTGPWTITGSRRVAGSSREHEGAALLRGTSSITRLVVVLCTRGVVWGCRLWSVCKRGTGWLEDGY